MRVIMRLMQIICYLSAFLILLVGTLVVIYQGNVDLELTSGEQPFVIQASSNEFDGTTTIWTYLQFTGVVLLVTYMFFRLGRLMSEFLKGRYFSKAAVQHMRIVAAIYLAYTLYSFAQSKYQILQSGDHDDLWNVSGDDIFGVMLSMTFLIIAHVLNEARKNKDELEGYF